MNKHIKENKEVLLKKNIPELKDIVTKDCWVALRQYFDGKGNGPEAKIACVVLSTLAKEQQSKNNARQLDIIERRLITQDPERLSKK